MRILLHSRSFYIFGALILIGIAAVSLISTLRSQDEELVTTTVTRGDVLEIVSVSGVVESNTTAELSFPVSDTVTSLTVSVGDVVAAGDILMTLRQSSLLAQRRDALATLHIVQANRDELLAGPRSEARDVTDTTITSAEANLARTIVEQDEKVANALRALLSNDLEAVPTWSGTNDIPPTISGAYTCGETGIYTIEVYSSNARSGFSYRIKDLETGTYEAFTESPSLVGTCGLAVQFVSGESYGNTTWTVAIPNTRSATYTTYLNSYELARVTRDNAVQTAEEALDTALKNKTLDNASPRDEALRRANAEVLRASAGLERIDAQIEDRTLRAPFSGTVTNVDVVVGETVRSAPVITLLGENTFDLEARIPEIDIAKIAVHNKADVTFDARANEIIPATISFISPLAIEIDGVAYFEATLTFPETPAWLRAGLNADIDIIVNKQADTLRLPKRFIREDDGTYFVLVPRDEVLEEISVEASFVGNDGFIAITGLNEGDTVVAP